MQKVINIPEDVVADIETKDLKCQSLSAILKDLIETHSKDEDTSFMTSPVIMALQKQITDARKDWEDAKNAMALKYINDVDSKHTTNWNLNYGTCELTLTLVSNNK